MENEPKSPSRQKIEGAPNVSELEQGIFEKSETINADPKTRREHIDELKRVIHDVQSLDTPPQDFIVEPSATVDDQIEHDLGIPVPTTPKPHSGATMHESGDAPPVVKVKTRSPEEVIAAREAWNAKRAAARPGGGTASVQPKVTVPEATEGVPPSVATQETVVEATPAFADSIPENQGAEEAPPLAPESDAQSAEGEETEQDPQLTVEEVDKESKEAREARQKALYERMVARNNELDKKAEGLGPKVGKFVRYLGEGYGKMSLKRKFVIGVGLGISVITLAEVAPLIAGASAAALSAQRVLGGLNVFVRIEKHLTATAEGTSTGRIGNIEKYQKFWATSTEKQRTLAAAGLALAYTGLASYGVRKALGLGSEAFEWLKLHYNYDYPGFINMDATATPTQVEASPTPSADYSVATQPEVAPPTSEMPTIYADASPKGYESMIKNIWQQLHDQNATAPADLDPNSDLAKLLNADEKTIGSVAHRIASDAEGGRGFFNEATGESVRIDPQARLSIGADHQLHFSDPTHPDIIDATEKLAERTTPKFPPETPVTHTEAPAAPAESASVEPDHPIIQDETIADDQAHYGAEAPDTDVTTPESIVNEHGITVMTSEPHIYADKGAEHLFVYGGSPEEKAALVGKYFSDPAHAEDIVYSPDANNAHRIALRMVNGEVVAGTPVRTKGFLGFFSSFMEAAEPDEFRKIIQ